MKNLSTLQQLKSQDVQLTLEQLVTIVTKSQKATDNKKSANFLVWKLAYAKAMFLGHDIAVLKEKLAVNVSKKTVSNVIGAIATATTNGVNLEKFTSANAVMTANKKIEAETHLVDAKGDVVIDKEKSAIDKQDKVDKVASEKNFATTTRAKKWYKDLVESALNDGVDAIELYKILKIDLAKK